MDRVRVQVTGVVQGVGFRWFARRAATALGLTGWVRNRPDGSVEAEAQGGAAAIAAFIEELRIGSPAADVRGVETARISPEIEEREFRIRF